MPDSFEHPNASPRVSICPQRLGFEWVRGGGDGLLDRALDRL